MARGRWKKIEEETWKLRRGKLVQVPYQWVLAHKESKMPPAYRTACWQQYRLKNRKRRRRGLYKLCWPKLVVLLNKVNERELELELKESMLDFR